MLAAFIPNFWINVQFFPPYLPGELRGSVQMSLTTKTKHMEEIKTQFPNRLREFRLRQGLSQKQVVRRVLGIEVTRLARYESGELLPSLMHAMRLSFFYQQPMQVIFPEIAHQIRSEILSNPVVIRSIRRRAFYAEEAI